MLNNIHPYQQKLQDAQIYLFGDSAIVLESSLPTDSPDTVILPQQQKIWSLASALRQRGHQYQHNKANHHFAIKDVIVGNLNVTIAFDPIATDREFAINTLAQIWQDTPTQRLAPNATTLEVPVHYGGHSGPDLLAVAEYHQIEPAEVVAMHCEPLYTVLFIGFQPGFAYLHGLPVNVHTPRKAIPRTYVPSGSVGIGGSQTGIYPFESPGGWQIIGRYDESAHGKLFDAQREPTTLFNEGMQVKFIPDKITL